MLLLSYLQLEDSELLPSVALLEQQEMHEKNGCGSESNFALHSVLD